MARSAAVIFFMLSALTAEAQIWRATYRPFDWSAGSSKRIPQFFLVTTFAELPTLNVGDGDIAYVESPDATYMRIGGAWTQVFTVLTPPATPFYQFVRDEGITLTQRATLLFSGAGVTCSDNPPFTQCIIPGGGGTTPTGTGYVHVTAGVQDAAASLVTLTSATDVAPNQGTTTTVLHGNAAGQASFGAVALADIASGVLGWTDAGANVTLVTDADTVTVGTATPTASTKLTVAGNVGPDSSAGSRSLGTTTARWIGGFFGGAVGVSVGPDSTGGVADFHSASNAKTPNFTSELASATGADGNEIRYQRTRGTLGAHTTVALFDIVKLELSEADAGGGYTPIVQEYSYVASRTGTTDVSGTWGVATRPPGAGAIPIARLEIDHKGNFIWGDQTNNIATTATDKFMYLGSGAGQPTGTPSYIPLGANPVFYDHTNNALFANSNATWHQVGTNLIRVASDFATTATSFSNVTGLTYPVKASAVYAFECNLVHTTAISTTAPHVSINGPAGATAMRFAVTYATAAAATFSSSSNAYDGFVNPLTGAAAVALPIVMKGILENGATAGTFAVRLRSEISGSAVTLLRGSYCNIQQQ